MGETSYRLEFLSDSGIIPPARLNRLQQETEQLVAIFASSAVTAKKAKR